LASEVYSARVPEDLVTDVDTVEKSMSTCSLTCLIWVGIFA